RASREIRPRPSRQRKVTTVTGHTRRTEAEPVRLPPSPRQWLGQRWRRLAEHGDVGSSTVELAILTPLLVGLLLFVVFCGRLVSAQLDLDAAAHGAARAASISRTVSGADADARRTALDTLAARGVTCRQPTITVDTGGQPPSRKVRGNVSCTAPPPRIALLSRTR